MCKKLSFLILALVGILVGVNAQETKGIYLKLSHYLMIDPIDSMVKEIPADDEEVFDKLASKECPPIVEEFLLTGAEILIEDNEVLIIYASEPEKNSKFDFDRITGFEFELRGSTGIAKAPVTVLRAYVDKANMLQVEAEKALGQVNVYTVTGALVASQKTDGNRTQINLSAVPRGIYVVQAGHNRLLIINH